MSLLSIVLAIISVALSIAAVIASVSNYKWYLSEREKRAEADYKQFCMNHEIEKQNELKNGGK